MEWLERVVLGQHVELELRARVLSCLALGTVARNSRPRTIEQWLTLDQRLRQRNKIAVVSFLLPTCLPVARARAGSRENRKIHLVSFVAEVIISGDSVLNDTRKDLTKEVKMDLARFTYEPLGVLILNCLRQLRFKLMLSWIVVRQKQLVVSKQCRFWLML